MNAAMMEACGPGGRPRLNTFIEITPADPDYAGYAGNKKPPIGGFSLTRLFAFVCGR
jgi:hypothetical protein